MKISITITSILLFTTPFILAQTVAESKVYETYDNIIGVENTGLFNGTEFTDLFLNTNGTYRYFKGYDYVRGAVYYNGEFYSNVLLKYDLLEDNLITHSEGKLSVFNVKLIPDFVTSFSIYNRDFVKLVDINLPLPGNGFFEEAYLGNQFKLYIKHNKRKKDKALNSGVQYRFSINNYYLLQVDGHYAVINSIKDLRRALPEREDDIRKYYKSYKKLYKSDPDNFLIKLLKHLEGLSKPSKF
ncbi:hypothetical protein [Aequorivita xiaoshiensis]|uniref:Uncharacterized protein n=1 Tax=Aequorivita xiaoshiensis TaxID=2874476 RepID=A0A9X1R0G3_9FLAO|nr:hypothetical protein [Aequorivita xiaoshiensis]MCG2430450.1 hypothetical protein [Aequorivita xiaoshiensis]